jgi:hypothetical protein
LVVKQSGLLTDRIVLRLAGSTEDEAFTISLLAEQASVVNKGAANGQANPIEALVSYKVYDYEGTYPLVVVELARTVTGPLEVTTQVLRESGRDGEKLEENDKLNWLDNAIWLVHIPAYQLRVDLATFQDYAERWLLGSVYRNGKNVFLSLNPEEGAAAKNGTSLSTSQIPSPAKGSDSTQNEVPANLVKLLINKCEIVEQSRLALLALKQALG